MSETADFSELSEFFLELLFRPTGSFAWMSLQPTGSSLHSTVCPLPLESGTWPFPSSHLLTGDRGCQWLRPLRG